MKALIATIFSVWEVLFSKKGLVLGILIFPAMLTFLAGVGYDHNNVLPLRIGMHASAMTPIGFSVLDTFEDLGYEIIKYKTSDLCIDRVKEGQLHSCVILGKKKGREEAIFYVNPSDLALADHLRSIVHDATIGPGNEIAKNSTKQLLSEVSSAREAAAEIRPTIVDLTTNYQSIKKEVDAFVTYLGVETPPLDLTALSKNETIEGNQDGLLKWIDDVSGLRSDMLHVYEDRSVDVKSRLEQSAIAEADKLAIFNILNEGKTEMNDIADDFRIGETLSRTRSGKLTSAVQDLIVQLDSVQKDIEAFNELKATARYRAAKIKGHVDSTLLGVASVQKSLNIIGSAVLDVTGSDPDAVLVPLDAKIGTLRGESTPFDFVFPNVLLLFVVIAGISLGGMMHIHFDESPGSIRRRMGPVPPHVHAAGQHIAVWIVVSIVGFVMSATALLFLPIQWSTLPLLGLAVAGTGLVSVLMGSWIGHWMHSEEQMVLWGMGFSTALVLLSPMLRPLEHLPEFMRLIASVNPLTLGLQITRSAVGGGAFNTEALLLLGIASFSLWLVLLLHKE